MRLAWLGLLLLCLVAPSFGQADCPSVLSHLTAKSPAQISFLQTLEAFVDRTDLTFIEKEAIYKKALEVQVQESEVSSSKIRFKKTLNPMRLLGFSGRKVLLWPKAESLVGLDATALGLKVADLTGELMFEFPQNPNIFSQTPASFFRNNMNAVVTKLYLQYFTLTEGAMVPPKSEALTYTILKNVLKAMLPYEFSEVKSAKLDTTTVQLFETGGSQAVYKHVRNVYGPSVAMKYWLRHLKTASQALFLTFCLYLAPTAHDTWNLMAQESSVQLSGVNPDLAATVLRDFKKSDVQLMESLKAETRDEKEAQALASFEKAYAEENETKK